MLQGHTVPSASIWTGAGNGLLGALRSHLGCTSTATRVESGDLEASLDALSGSQVEGMA